MDVTDIVDFNLALLNPHHLVSSYFCLSQHDPTNGFAFDATKFAGHAYPHGANPSAGFLPTTRNGFECRESLDLRLVLGSHLAQHLRHLLEQHKGFTSTAGISTSKLLSKLAGNVNKPRGQTTLLPPYAASDGVQSNVSLFVDSHEVGNIPGIGFKLATKIRSHILQRQVEYDPSLVTGRTKDAVTCGQVRTYPGMSAELLENLLAGPGMPSGIGAKVWDLINGIDDTVVSRAREVPRQISIEDSYMRLDSMDQVIRELQKLSRSIIKRMHADLLEDDESPAPDEAQQDESTSHSGGSSLRDKRWRAHPRTVRLSTRPRPAVQPDGSRSGTFARISRSGPLPSFIFNLTASVESLAERLVADTLAPMFRKLHPEKSGWNLSLVNVAVVNMADAASDKGAGSVGRDIGKMFKRQGDALREWKVADKDVAPDFKLPEGGLDAEDGRGSRPDQARSLGSEDDFRLRSDSSDLDHVRLNVPEDAWDSEGDDADDMEDVAMCICNLCRARMPLFALPAHERFHAAEG